MDPKLRTLLFLILQSMLLLSPSLATRQTYIVHMDPTYMPSAFSSHEDWYSSHLLQSLSSSDTITTTSSSSPLLYTYSAAYNGYAASLTPDEAESLRSSSGGAVIGVYEDTVYNLHTTRTPEFLGLDSPAVAYASEHIPLPSGDVIVGILDTGIWPESASFDDAGLPPVPSRWRGECESASDFKPSLCNRKLIGARSFSRGYAMAAGANFMKNPTEKDSPRDYDGHGTHTASTAAGSKVANASLLGYASGTARGMAPPRARVAAYKVCWTSGCFGSDILAGMDRAILDGVDVLSLSLGGGSAPYYRDTIATGAFSAMVKGIFVSCSAGNSGPAKSSLANTAPWIMTVGAGTLDRDFPSYATLGDRRRVAGVSLYSGKGMDKKLAPLVYGNGNVGNNTSSSTNGNMCLTGTLDPKMVNGKVVLCDRGVNARVEKGAVVRDAGGVGMILANTAANGEELVADSHLIPAVAVGKKAGDRIREYVKRAGTNAKATLTFGGTVLGVKPSPVVAAFSSRGPNLVTPQILKPDVIGPGVNILAAWSEAVGPTGLDKDTRRSKFNIMSGTSMSCPHISGLAALIKAAHPDWSPSAIKSALMTTAYTHDNALSPLQNAEDGSVSNPWAYGAGHVNPRQALSPGLIYDITPQDYISFICSLGYTLDRVRAITKMPNVTCSTKLSDPGQLNYPSFSVLFGKTRTVRYTRELTNVGPDRSFYQVRTDVPTNVGVKVRPSKLFFRKAGEKKKYTVTFVARKGKAIPKDRAGFGSIMWFNKQNQVRSPVSFMWNHQL